MSWWWTALMLVAGVVGVVWAARAGQQRVSDQDTWATTDDYDTDERDPDE